MLELSDIKARFTGRQFTFTCPRCNKIQTVDIDLDKIVRGIEIECQNTDICGQRLFYFKLRMEIVWSVQMGLLDVPLEEIK